ncbi:hypothetical protein [Streptomyces sp. NPDC018610]|uniref:hypothetical protein n=1 Tax=Streptomyces sp. NPDC018610 TaxID=3365049 RepID=UPI0037A68C69
MGPLTRPGAASAAPPAGGPTPRPADAPTGWPGGTTATGPAGAPTAAEGADAFAGWGADAARPAATDSETTRLRPVSPHRTPAPAAPPRSAASPGRVCTASPDPALSWSAAGARGPVLDAPRAYFALGEPEGYDERGRGRALGARLRPRTAVAAACVVLGLGLIGGAATGSWLTGGSAGGGPAGAFAAAGALWHDVPVDQLFPPTVLGAGAGPGGADRTWTRVAVAPDGGCADAFDPLLRKALAPVGCARLLRATYTDATQSYVTTVGLLFTDADATDMAALAARFENEGLARRTDLMPRPYAAEGTVAAAFGDKQRASWTVSVLTEAPVVVYAVSGWADGRTVDAPQPAADAMRSGATAAPAQAGLGNEAQGLADRVERGFRKTAAPATEKPS